MKLAHDQHVDWPRLVSDLQGAGHSLDAIGKSIGANKGRVKAWVLIEAQPRHDDGERLLALWCKVLTRLRTDAPVVSRYA